MAEKLVWRDSSGYYNFRHPGGFIYDFRVTEAMPSDVWIRQMSSKTWVTDSHMAEFRRLLAVHHG